MEYLLLFIGLCLVFRFGRVPVRAVAFAAVCLWGAYEAAYGLLQILGLRPSLNPAFVLTGHFENPGPYGGFIAMTMAVSGAYLMRFWRRRRGFYRAVMFGIAVLNFTLGLLVLPASMSRAAWVALVASLLLSLLMDRRLRTWIHRHLLLCGVLAGLALIAVGGAFMMKRDSALGRLHIWRIEAIAISEHPLGTGPGTALGTYGKTQEQFFRERLHDVPESVVRVAGCHRDGVWCAGACPLFDRDGMGDFRSCPAEGFDGLRTDCMGCFCAGIVSAECGADFRPAACFSGLRRPVPESCGFRKEKHLPARSCCGRVGGRAFHRGASFAA